MRSANARHEAGSPSRHKPAGHRDGMPERLKSVSAFTGSPPYLDSGQIKMHGNLDAVKIEFYNVKIVTGDRGQRSRSVSAQRREKRPRHAYHHGDLRKALLEAAEAELAEKASRALRCAAAPSGPAFRTLPLPIISRTPTRCSPHWLLSPPQRLYDSMESRHGRAEKTPRAQLIASGRRLCRIRARQPGAVPADVRIGSAGCLGSRACTGNRARRSWSWSMTSPH